MHRPEEPGGEPRPDGASDDAGLDSPTIEDQPAPAMGSETRVDAPAAQRRARARVTGSVPALSGRGERVDTDASELSTSSAVGSAVSSGRVRPTGTMSASQIGLTTAREALFKEEIHRTRMFSAMALVMCFFVLAGFPLLGGNQLLKTITMVGAAISVITSLWIIFVYRDTSRYSQMAINFTATLSVIITYNGVVFWGINSPAPVLILFGLYFFTRGQSFPVALFVYVLCAATQGLAAFLILSGTIDDPGLITADAAPFHVRLLTQLIVQMVFASTFVIARASRGGTLRAMDELVLAQRQVAQREAAFQEVRQDLDLALGVQGLGHHSGKVLGRWHLGRVIGRGAMGEVYEATDSSAPGGDRVAVKLLHPNVLEKPSSVDRFLREARAASALSSPHAVRVIEASDPGEPVPYLVMELLRGTDLANILRQKRRLTINRTVELVRQVGSVIDMAGRKGIVHRDLKPQNLFRCDGARGPAQWKVLDFGASKLAENSGTLTQGRVVGTPAYMSPEQARGEDVTVAADRYSLAAIVYRCLTGRPPFSGKDMPTTLYRVVYGTPPQPSVLADLPEAVDVVLMVGMAKSPRHRFHSGAEFAEALDRAGRGELDPELRSRAEGLLAQQPWGVMPR